MIFNPDDVIKSSSIQYQLELCGGKKKEYRRVLGQGCKKWCGKQLCHFWPEIPAPGPAGKTSKRPATLLDHHRLRFMGSRVRPGKRIIASSLEGQASLEVHADLHAWGGVVGGAFMEFHVTNSFPRVKL
jgi:hypothetical protein